MAGVRFTELQSRPMEFLDFTSVTLDEFQQLVPPFETAFQCHMAAWRMDGKPRTARRFTVYKTCPLPTPEDRLVFILTYIKTYALQVVQGRLFGMVQGKANRWIHILLPTLFGPVTLWSIVLPGTETQVVLPAPAVQKLRNEQMGTQLYVEILASRSPKFSYNQWTYDTLSGVSWSSFTVTDSDFFTP